MPMPDRHTPAELVWSLHAPWQATVAECLQRWRALPPQTREGSYLVLRGSGGRRRTLSAAAIAELAATQLLAA